MYYSKRKNNLKINFEGIKNIQRNYAQAYQDIFVLSMLDGKSDGYFLEIGAFDPKFISNTYLLEKVYNWRGLSIDSDPAVERKFKRKRSSNYLTADAVDLDYSKILKNLNFPNQIDYLCLDIEPSQQTLECLKNLPLAEYRFSVITYETDFYSTHTSSEESVKIRDESRKILESFGYILVGKGIACTGPSDVFEDWYIDPTIVPESRYLLLKTEDEFNDSAERFLTTNPHLVSTELWNGQGLGNQLWAYAVTRAISEKRGLDFAILGKDRFKGKEFMSMDFGVDLQGGKSPEGGPARKLPKEIDNYLMEDYYIDNELNIDVSPFDPKILNCPINSKIEGNFQSYKYIEGLENSILEWFKVDTTILPKNLCLIHIRGGDFKNLKHLYLGPTYYERAINLIRNEFPEVVFKCVTDDIVYAMNILPNDVEFIGSCLDQKVDTSQAAHHIGGNVSIDFSLMCSANYLIIPNSSFSWWAAFLNQNKKLVIAPKYWAGYNSSKKIWSTSEIATPGFKYLDKNGQLFSYKEIVDEQVSQLDKNFGNRKLVVPPWREVRSKRIIRKIMKKLRYSGRD